VRTYEAVVIFNNVGDAVNSGKEFLKKEIADNGGTIEQEEDMGERTLAYPVKKNDTGRYYFVKMRMAPDKIGNLGRAVKLRAEVLKSFILAAG
jgi:small subunit ribosomal protein S6